MASMAPLPMMFNPGLNALLIVLLTTLTLSEAFQPCSYLAPRAPSPSRTIARMATLQKEDRMTNDDIEVLFGDDAMDKSSLQRPTGRHRHKSKTGNILVDVEHPVDPLEHSRSSPLVNKLHTMRDLLENCPQLWGELSKHCGDLRAIYDERLCDETIDVTFSEMDELVKRSAAVFSGFGVKKGVNVAVLGENSARWLMVDHGIQMAGGASAVRGADAPLDELQYIYEHSDSAGIAVLQGPKLLKKLAKDAKAKNVGGLGLSNASHGLVNTIILMHREKISDEEIQQLAKENNVEVYVFADLLRKTQSMSPDRLPDVGLDDVATIVYTSGTTGRPKGVMLTHANLLHQTEHRLGPTRPYDETEPLPGETTVSILPVWHITERTFELWLLSRGCSVAYSSIRSFKNDLAKHNPEWLVLVPRVLEKIASGVQDKFSSGSPAVQALAKLFTQTGQLRATHTKIAKGLVLGDEPPSAIKKAKSRFIVASLAPLNAAGDKLVWSKVKDGFGGNVKAIIAGGSALVGALETFYETCGIPICVGYGLTECSPLLSFRRKDANMVTAGCAGTPCTDTELRIVDPRSDADTSERVSLPMGKSGLILARGPQIMKGYYKNPEATAKAIDKYGWFDTGDLGFINPATGDLVLTGRAKDTIVLSNGENIEPVPIEDVILGESPLIEQVMLLGQDGRRLVAIIVLNPHELTQAGYLTEKQGKDLQAENDKVNDPQCTEEDCEAGCEVLNQAAEKLRANQDLSKELENIVRRATSGFRKWEQVSDVYITLEPFAMANGQLTQSYKVKRASVTDRYGESI